VGGEVGGEVVGGGGEVRGGEVRAGEVRGGEVRGGEVRGADAGTAVVVVVAAGVLDRDAAGSRAGVAGGS